MTKATKKIDATKPVGKGVVGFPVPADQEKAKAFAELALNPNVSAAAVCVEYLKPTMGEQDLGSRVEFLTAATARVNDGDMSRCEAMFFGQAQALQDIFVALARRASKQTQLPQWDAAMRMALRAQNQSRMTLETLATVKNPPVVFAKQANFAAGNQQVNNSVPSPSDPSRTRKSEIERNRLLEADHGQRLDTRAPSTASGTNQELETVGAINRTADNRR